ncbi:DUF4249 domain-containing protein [Reichenbachiella carrageenanivorans]|uniref:DUF4249 domain-containing protein n=1 Tax=Reichenbachiella carrageenanivorans TaxID=2979869 RepID=A0ABY6D5J0_9BACT|nr:DUF4249 domain-containing protein [Reichenbachiella carrageenanivorans]UXX80388.1 DUF4249 domain-containing protein [Reichenbachiella carrageenanivorans]
MNIKLYTILIVALAIFSACDDQIYPELDDAPEILVVDAWVTDLMEDQVVRLTKTAPYFENTATKGVTGAQVYITDDQGTSFDFVDQGNGNYVWTPATSGFGMVGSDYVLTVVAEGNTYTAISTKNRVPKVDSITFEYNNDKTFGVEEIYYSAELWASDLGGLGDQYWIKTYKNDVFLNKPSEISLVWDGGFNRSSTFDGEPFIPPIRQSINPYDTNEEEELISPYLDGDKVYVEIHSITEAAHNFLSEVQIQTNREGGFGALFATPLSNVPTNIENTTSEDLVVGFFCVSAVESKSAVLDESQVPKDE